MIENTDLFLEYYTFQVQNDKDTKDEHRELWATILARFNELKVTLSTLPYDML